MVAPSWCGIITGCGTKNSLQELGTVPESASAAESLHAEASCFRDGGRALAEEHLGGGGGEGL